MKDPIPLMTFIERATRKDYKELSIRQFTKTSNKSKLICKLIDSVKKRGFDEKKGLVFNVHPYRRVLSNDRNDTTFNLKNSQNKARKCISPKPKAYYIFLGDKLFYDQDKKFLIPDIEIKRIKLLLKEKDNLTFSSFKLKFNDIKQPKNKCDPKYDNICPFNEKVMQMMKKYTIKYSKSNNSEPCEETIKQQENIRSNVSKFNNFNCIYEKWCDAQYLENFQFKLQDSLC